MKNCGTCAYWNIKYRQCEHPYQYACESDEYQAPAEKICNIDSWEQKDGGKG
jgi:hypothetical protein